MTKHKLKRSRPEASTSNTPAKSVKSPRIVLQEEEGVVTPFADIPIKWEYKRYHLINNDHKTMLTGYELMAGNIKCVLKTLQSPARDEVRRSCFKYYTQLEDYNTRSGNMLHYVVFREITPTPNLDTTTLWFKIGNDIIHFSWEEYALVSGLRFGQANFNPYRGHEVPADSAFARLFWCNDKTTTAQVKEMFVNKKFTYWEGDGPDRVEIEIPAIEDDYVKLAKLLLALTYALGYEQTRKAIPIWIWVLLEDRDAWEQFPWGSLSYQLLTHSITNVKKDKVPPSGVVSYHILGNTIAFSAWIFVPTLGRDIGVRKDVVKTPRMLRYSYITPKQFPRTKHMKTGIQPLLIPTDELSQDPVKMPFAFKYDSNDNKKKKQRNDHLPAANAPHTPATSATLQIDEALVKKLGEYAGNAAAEKMKEYIDKMKESIMNEILECLNGRPRTDVQDADDIEHYVFNDNEQSPQHSEHHDESAHVEVEIGDVTEIYANEDEQMTAEKKAAAALEAADRLAAAVAAEKAVAAASKAAPVMIAAECSSKSKESDDVLSTEGASLKSTEDAAAEKERSKLAASHVRTEKKADVEVHKDESEKAGMFKIYKETKASENKGKDGGEEDITGKDDEAAETAAGTKNTEEIATEGTSSPVGAKQATDAEKANTMEEESLTDTQMCKALDDIMTSMSEKSTALIIAPIPTEDVALQILEPGKTRPQRLRYPSRACKSPYRHDDKRAGITTFETYMSSKKDTYRNVRFHFAVDKDFFKTILNPDKLLEEDAMNSYLSILSAKSEFAGVGATQENIAIAPSYFIYHIEEVFDAIHKKKKKNALYLYQTKDFKPDIEEKLTEKQMEKLLAYAAAEYPCWGDNMRP